jgi:hypothetical protein
MRKHGWYFFAVLFAMQSVALFGQATERTKPGFTLFIEDDKNLSGGYPFGYHRLLVTYTNNTDQVEDDSMLDPDLLNMIVLRDGAPAEETKEMRELRKSMDDLKSGKAMGHAWVLGTIKPGKSVTIPLYISDYFDTSKPDTYTITVSQETFPWEPEKNVTVWSNTLTIVVPEPEAAAPK